MSSMSGFSRVAGFSRPRVQFIGPCLRAALSRTNSNRIAPVRTLASAATKQASQDLHVYIDDDNGLPVVIETKNVPIFLYAQEQDVEPEAISQLVNLAESPLPVGFVSAMPDVHVGKGVPIGTVFASTEYVCPNAVGEDIGCGTFAVPIKGLHKDEISHKDLVRIQSLIKERIPTGFAKHENALFGTHCTIERMRQEYPHSEYLRRLMMDSKVVRQLKRQLGTLGGRSHFLEVLYDEDGQVWVMLHNGSGELGITTAQEYDRIAKKQLDTQGITVPEGLNYLRIDSQEGQNYLQDINWCLRYAWENRRFMRDLLLDIIEEVTNKGNISSIDWYTDGSVYSVQNYCQCEPCSYMDPRTGEEIDDKDMWVTRKGAIPAWRYRDGIVSGLMGTGSYITVGKGNSQSWNSCSHGAGRHMSRAKAKAMIKQKDSERAMTGIGCDTVSEVKDEAPQACKDLSVVMANQESLVGVAHRLYPLITVKGIEYGKRGR